MGRTLLLMAGFCVTAALGYSRYTVEIPAQHMLVKTGSSDPHDIVAIFPESARLVPADARLLNTELLPYWRWQFQVVRDLELFRYGVTLSIMGNPAEGLKYRDKSKADWHRPELEAWADTMLHRFEADTWDTWTAYRKPPTDAQEDDFKKALTAWFRESSFANQGIHIDEIVVGLPRLGDR